VRRSNKDRFAVTLASPNPTPAAIQAADAGLKAALTVVYGDDDYSVPEGAKALMEEALRWPTYAAMANALYGNAFHIASGRVRKAMMFEMAAIREANDAALNAAQAARYAADPFARFDDQRAV
jgi:hypothetical protein